MDIKRNFSFYCAAVASFLALGAVVVYIVLLLRGDMIDVKLFIFPLIVLLGAGTTFIKFYKN